MFLFAHSDWASLFLQWFKVGMIFLIPACNARTNAQEADIHVDTFIPPADRIVAIGDGHGDVDALRSCLKVVLSCCFA